MREMEWKSHRAKHARALRVSKLRTRLVRCTCVCCNEATFDWVVRRHAVNPPEDFCIVGICNDYFEQVEGQGGLVIGESIRQDLMRHLDFSG